MGAGGGARAQRGLAGGWAGGWVSSAWVAGADSDILVDRAGRRTPLPGTRSPAGGAPGPRPRCGSRTTVSGGRSSPPPETSCHDSTTRTSPEPVSTCTRIRSKAGSFSSRTCSSMPPTVRRASIRAVAVSAGQPGQDDDRMPPQRHPGAAQLAWGYRPGSTRHRQLPLAACHRGQHRGAQHVALPPQGAVPGAAHRLHHGGGVGGGGRRLPQDPRQLCQALLPAHRGERPVQHRLGGLLLRFGGYGQLQRRRVHAGAFPQLEGQPGVRRRLAPAEHEADRRGRDGRGDVRQVQQLRLAQLEPVLLHRVPQLCAPDAAQGEAAPCRGGAVEPGQVESGSAAGQLLFAAIEGRHPQAVQGPGDAACQPFHLHRTAGCGQFQDLADTHVASRHLERQQVAKPSLLDLPLQPAPQRTRNHRVEHDGAGSPVPFRRIRHGDQRGERGALLGVGETTPPRVPAVPPARAAVPAFPRGAIAGRPHRPGRGPRPPARPGNQTVRAQPSGR